MGIESKSTLKGYFERGDQPTSAQFSDLIDSLLKLPTSGNTAKNGFLEVETTASATAHVPSDFSRGLFLNISTTAGARNYLAVTSASSQGGGAAGQAILNANATASVVSLLGVPSNGQLTSATESAFGLIEIATTAEVSAREAGERALTPANLGGSPLVAKAVLNFNGSAQASIKSSKGVSAVTRADTGDYSIVWAEPFATPDYVVVVTPGGNNRNVVYVSAISVSSVALKSQESTVGADADSDLLFIVAWGDQ